MYLHKGRILFINSPFDKVDKVIAAAAAADGDGADVLSNFKASRLSQRSVHRSFSFHFSLN